MLGLLPAICVVALAFGSGGFLPGPVALGAAALCVLLTVRILVVRRPVARLSTGYVVGAAALALLACWTLLSGAWSDAPARAVTEYDRAMLYLLGFLVMGSLGRTPGALRWMVRGLAGAACLICACGLITRLAPDVWATRPSVQPGRLSYPVGYWNGLGLLAAIGIILGFALTSDDRETPTVRILAAATLPICAATLLLTFSRGAIVAGAVGLISVIVVARPRALISGLLVAGATIPLAVTSSYGADLLATNDPANALATAQGHQLGLVLAACAALAAGARAALLALDRRVGRLVAPQLLGGRRARAAVVGLTLATALIVGVVLDVPSTVRSEYEQFIAGEHLAPEQDLRGRLTDPGSNGRIDLWRVAVDGFQEQPLRGTGAGTFALEWDRRRNASHQEEDAHSLYAEMLGELGVVGVVLLLVAIVLILAGFVARARGPDRVLGGSLFAAGLAWALHAGIDWDWELPAVTFWFFAAGGLALAAPAERSPNVRELPYGVRAAIALGCLLLAVLPVRVYLSEGPRRDSAFAFAAGDCAGAIDRALDSSSRLGLRPEPFIVLGYCEVRLGRPDLAATAMRAAVRRDPHNWEGYYGLAVARAAGGADPRLALRVAKRLNPLEELIGETQRLLGDKRLAWSRRVAGARLPTD